LLSDSQPLKRGAAIDLPKNKSREALEIIYCPATDTHLSDCAVKIAALLFSTQAQLGPRKDFFSLSSSALADKNVIFTD
jgi:hypothetical protein